jgi:hypothetical protein
MWRINMEGNYIEKLTNCVEIMSELLMTDKDTIIDVLFENDILLDLERELILDEIANRTPK